MKRKSTNETHPRKYETYPRPKPLPGLKMSLPALKKARVQGPWFKRSVERWNLIAPFDPNVTEKDWEKYYKERAALDWYAMVIWDWDERKYPPWTEDFPQPKMSDMFTSKYGDNKPSTIVGKAEKDSLRKAIKSVIDDCPELLACGLKEGEDLGEKMGSGLYFLKVNVETVLDENSELYTDMTVTTRLYSPFGLGTSIDFELCWCMQREPYADQMHYAKSRMAIRSASFCRPLHPTLSQTTVLKTDRSKRAVEFFTVIEKPTDMGAKKAHIESLYVMSSRKLRLAEKALFGFENLLPDSQIFSLLAHSTVKLPLKRIFNRLEWEGEELKEIQGTSISRSWGKDADLAYAHLRGDQVVLPPENLRYKHPNVK